MIKIQRDILFGESFDYKVDHIANMRNLKIKLLNDDLNFEVNKERIDLHFELLDFISNSVSNKFKDFIITGSLALSLYGLLDRKPNDLDILIAEDYEYPYIKVDLYSDKDHMINRLGYLLLNYKKNNTIFDFLKRPKSYMVDVFYNESAL